MDNTATSHSQRRRIILDEIKRRDAAGESLSVREICRATRGSFRTISSVLMEYRAQTALRFLDGRAALSPTERESVLRERLDLSYREKADLAQENLRLSNELDEAQKVIAAQRDSIARFEGQLSPIWKEMLSSLDMLRHLRVEDLASAIDALKRQVTAKVADPSKQEHRLVAENQHLIGQVVKLTEQITVLERRLEYGDDD